MVSSVQEFPRNLTSIELGANQNHSNAPPSIFVCFKGYRSRPNIYSGCTNAKSTNPVIKEKIFKTFWLFVGRNASKKRYNFGHKRWRRIGSAGVVL